ncbi:hypothetical protein Q6D67_18700 [Haliea sp. E1-2-M8]|uniref:hypothetical protein n=1 Tax=Haliea sp. E1-2-M8 TaxID=3064706 RepID=UPI002720C5F9|nr:hypothetical protein [Haliea sp. E1-2-M8]MDO8863726.1 hypothetical protein [Haliea sp. E1-2-M8]
MEPLSTATAFATIIGLVGQFKSGRQSVSDDEYKEFSQWLVQNNHSETKHLIEQSLVGVTGIKSILNQDREILRSRLSQIDELLASVASRMEGFGEVAGVIHPNSVVSTQAGSILKQILDSGSNNMIELNVYGGPEFALNSGSIAYDDPQFIEDDLLTLVDMRLLRLDYNSKGGRVFYITRAARIFVEASGP